MAMIFRPLLALIASAADRELAMYIEYLKEENKILRARIPGQIHTKPSERERLMKFALTLQTHREGILNWYDHPNSTGPLEGTNNKIKLLQRQVYGYRDLPFFKLTRLALHHAQHALVRCTRFIVRLGVW